MIDTGLKEKVALITGANNPSCCVLCHHMALVQ